MSTELRPPPYPADARAKGWRFELDYEQIEQSDTWDLAGPEGRPWLLMMWMTAWRQLPCGSMPADEEVIAAKIGMPPKLWAKLHTPLMRGWYAASDGRLYHPTLTQRVEEMMKRRRSDSDRQAERRKLKASDTTVSHNGVTRDTSVTPHGVHPESSTDNRIPNTEEKTKTPRKRAAAAQLVSVEDLIGEGVAPQHARDWLAVRGSKKLPLTPTAWDETKSEASKAGISPAHAVKTAAANGWAGFKAKWLEEGTSKSGQETIDEMLASAK